MTPATARVFIVDDHPLVRRGLRDLLNGDPDFLVCGEAGSVAEALAGIEESNPDAVIVELTLSDGSGLDLIRRLKILKKDARIVVVTLGEESRFGEPCFRAGALGFVNQREAGETLIEALKAVLSGRYYGRLRFDETVFQGPCGSTAMPDGPPHPRLTARERQVFLLIGQGLATRQIAELLRLSSKTIETYREQIKAKLQLRNAFELTRLAIQWNDADRATTGE